MPVDPKNPWDLKMVPYEQPIVQFVDSLIDFAEKNGSRSHIHKEGDWRTMEYMYKGWCALYPRTASDFESHMKDLRANQLRRHAIAKDKRGGLVQHKMKIPKPLLLMIKSIWPDQRFNEKFVNEFARRFPMLKITNDPL